MWLSVLLAVLIAYLLGNLNGSICVSRLMRDDVRDHGSGNAGLTNFIRNYGSGKALAVILLDAGKTTIACFVGKLLLAPYGMALEGTMIAGTAVMLGHDFPAFSNFKGGKGILSGLFIALMADWRIAVVILGIFAAAYFATQYVSLGSVLAAIAFGVGFAVLHHDSLCVMLCGLFMAALTVFMHRGNIQRLLKGEERKTDLFAKGKKEE